MGCPRPAFARGPFRIIRPRVFVVSARCVRAKRPYLARLPRFALRFRARAVSHQMFVLEVWLMSFRLRKRKDFFFSCKSGLCIYGVPATRGANWGFCIGLFFKILHYY